MSQIQPNLEYKAPSDACVRFLEPAVLRRIEEALCRIGEFGEVRLIVVKGQLRFIETVQSENLNVGAR